MSDFAVTVSFRLKPGAAERFAPLVLEQARQSLEESGCHVFDVWFDATRPDEVFLYEIYHDAASFDRHLATPHFRRFDAAVNDLVLDKTVTKWTQKGHADG